LVVNFVTGKVLLNTPSPDLPLTFVGWGFVLVIAPSEESSRIYAVRGDNEELVPTSHFNAKLPRPEFGSSIISLRYSSSYLFSVHAVDSNHLIINFTVNAKVASLPGRHVYLVGVLLHQKTLQYEPNPRIIPYKYSTGVVATQPRYQYYLHSRSDDPSSPFVDVLDGVTGNLLQRIPYSTNIKNAYKEFALIMHRLLHLVVTPLGDDDDGLMQSVVIPLKSNSSVAHHTQPNNVTNGATSLVYLLNWVVVVQSEQIGIFRWSLGN
jgi:hypothetical protein